GRVGGGGMWERLTFRNQDCLPDAFNFVNSEGMNGRQETGGGFFGKIDIGGEVEFNNVLAGIMLESFFQTSKHFDVDSDVDLNPLYADPVFVGGISLFVGYGIW
ncbi:MAG: hypothetical protein AAGA56_25190, partial [Myxococcota bacterium]